MVTVLLRKLGCASAGVAASATRQPVTTDRQIGPQSVIGTSLSLLARSLTPRRADEWPRETRRGRAAAARVMTITQSANVGAAANSLAIDLNPLGHRHDEPLTVVK